MVKQIGKYNVDFAGLVYDEGIPYQMVSIFEFDGNKPVNEGRPKKTLYFRQDKGDILPDLRTEEDVEKLLRYRNHEKIHIYNNRVVEIVPKEQYAKEKLTIEEAIDELKMNTELDMDINELAPQFAKMLEELKHYKDLEGQGLLMRLPCKVGDTLYILHEKSVTEEKVRDVEYRGIKYQQGQRWFINIGALVYFEMDFGKTVFFTEEEAKAKQIELQEERKSAEEIER